MAQLHRRVPRLPNPHLIVLAVLLAAAPARAQEGAEVLDDEAPEVQRLAALAQQLGDEDAARREAARDAYMALTPDDLPAIRGRIERIRRGRPPHRWAVDIMNRFRRHGRTEEGPPVVVDGAMEELARAHNLPHEHERVVAMAEPALLWRALDAMGTLEAQRAAFPIIGFDEGLWVPVARNWIRRRGASMVAAALYARRDGDRFVRGWGRDAYERTGADDPGRAIPSTPPEQLPDVIGAYAEANIQSAMRVIVSYVGHQRRSVRRAARAAIEEYGGNAIWILRTAYRNEVGEYPPREWGWQHVAEALYARIDARRMAPVREALDAGIAARDAGDLDAMRASFDEVLARVPELEEPGPVAEGYAALGARALRAGDWDAARSHYRRAVRIAPRHEALHRWLAQIELTRARAAAARGIYDRAAYERVLEAAPQHEGAQAALAAIRPASSTPATMSTRRLVFGVAASIILALLGLSLLWRPRGEASVEPAHDDTALAPIEAPTLADPWDDTIDEADVTLPDAA